MPIFTITGPDAALLIGSLTEATVPPRTDLRWSETTGIDPVSNGQFSAARADADAWFAAATPCAAPTESVVDESGIRFFAFVGEPTDWAVPRGRRWRLKRCAPDGQPPTSYDVAVTETGDPAWVWVTGVHF